MKVAVIGAGWAGGAAAVEATRLGHQVSLFETARTAGGRARRVDVALAGQPLSLDNGQHILIGAYGETLRLMADIGVDLDTALLRLPLRLEFPDGDGFKLPGWDRSNLPFAVPPSLEALAGILTTRAWVWADKLSLLKAALGWQLGGFTCAPGLSVADLCRSLTPQVMKQLIEPLCVSALNTPAHQASGEVFLRVLHDSLFAQSGGSNLLLPRTDLSALLPDAACRWLDQNGGAVHLGTRVQALEQSASGWLLHGASPAESTAEKYDAVILACPPLEAARLVESGGLMKTHAGHETQMARWIALARGLQYEAITTVYAMAPHQRLAMPMLALPSDGQAEPAQFVFDRGQLGGPQGLLAFVVSASAGDSAALTGAVLAQGQRQLGLQGLTAIKTIVEKRATFACTPGLQRPAAQVASGLLACGDYVDGPYPATLEGAVRSGLFAARQLLMPPR